jgi:hypothetical protein
MTPEKKKKGPFRFIKTTFLIVFLLCLYLATSVPVGLFLYSVKSDIGINVFSKTGFHSYMSCLRKEAYKIKIMETSRNREPQPDAAPNDYENKSGH